MDSFAEGYAIGRDSGTSNGGAWGNDGMAFLWILVILAMFGGFGNGWGNNSGGALTRGELCQDMNFNDLQSAVRGISNGICDSTFALNNTMTNGFAGVQQSLCQGFNGTQREISNLGFELQSCCCGINRAIDGVNYNMAKNTCDIIQAGNANTQRIIDFLTTDKIASLQSENAALTAQLSQNAQTASIVSQLRPCPVPAYITCSPFESVYGYNTGYGRNNNGCGCC